MYPLTWSVFLQASFEPIDIFKSVRMVIYTYSDIQQYNFNASNTFGTMKKVRDKGSSS